MVKVDCQALVRLEKDGNLPLTERETPVDPDDEGTTELVGAGTTGVVLEEPRVVLEEPRVVLVEEGRLVAEVLGAEEVDEVREEVGLEVEADEEVAVGKEVLVVPGVTVDRMDEVPDGIDEVPVVESS